MLKPQRSLRPEVLRSSHEEDGRSTQSSHPEGTSGALLGAGANPKHPGTDKESKCISEQHLTSRGLTEPHTDKPRYRHAAGCLNQWRLQGNPGWQFCPSRPLPSTVLLPSHFSTLQAAYEVYKTPSAACQASVTKGSSVSSNFLAVSLARCLGVEYSQLGAFQEAVVPV